MSRILSVLATGALLLSSFTGCSSGRASIEGYEPEVVDGARIALLYPMPVDLSLSSPEAFAYSRGVASGGAVEMAHDEIRGMLPMALDAEWPKNTVLDYRTQPAGSIVPLDDQIGVDNPDMAVFGRAAREGNFDYIVVVRSISYQNESANKPGRVGEERVTATIRLIDPREGRIVVDEEVSASIDDPRVPRDTYVRLAEKIASEMPFSIE